MLSTLSLSDSVLPEWFVPLFTNLGVYFLITMLGYSVILYVRRNAPADGDDSMYAKFARFWVLGPLKDTEELIEESTKPNQSKDAPQQEYSRGMKALLLVFCTVGLLGSYLTWGVLQERIMSREYTTGRFESSNMLVFGNRVMALFAALIVTSFTKQPKMKAPYYEFSLTSLSNVLSSWCQLEALKYVSFPVQVLAKSSKMIPVMLMGKLYFRKSYPWYDYGIALAITGGVSLFMMSDQSNKDEDSVSTNVSGLMLLVGYLTFDSFTSQWQSHLFTQYKMSSYQMMIGVNIFSGGFTLIALLQTGELISSTAFMLENPEAMWDMITFSLAGTIGQMFIFFTIKTFGPLVFTMISTTRQLIAIFLSVIIFGHDISAVGMFGAVVVFAAIGFHIYKHDKEDKDKKKKPAANPPTNGNANGNGTESKPSHETPAANGKVPTDTEDADETVGLTTNVELTNGGANNGLPSPRAAALNRV